jgi:hypothetical protein
MAKTTKKTVRFTLTSNSLVFAPGVLRWAMNGYKFKRDRANMVKVMESWPGLSKAEWRGVLSGEIPVTVEDDKVLITLTRKVVS